MKHVAGTELWIVMLAGLFAVQVHGAPSESGVVPRITGIAPDNTVTASVAGQSRSLQAGERLGDWTLMAVVPSDSNRQWAVFEDFSQAEGSLEFINEKGDRVEFPKSFEPTWAEPGTLYHGHTREEVLASQRDLLGEEMLAGGRDPDYAEVATCFPPLTKTYTYTFVGTPECVEKVGIFYGGSSPNFDPAAYIPEIAKIRSAGRVVDGLVGGWLPVLRFVYPERAGDWSELLVYAPLRRENNNPRVQPVWYRLARIEGGVLKWARYFDSYHPYPPRTESRPESFYADLLALRGGWSRLLAGGMQIELPDQRLANLARFSLVREMMTRINGFPKYGVFDRGYGGSEHDGFPDTFTVDTAAMLEWGLFDQAGKYLDNYFTYFVRDDASILYRGPETGQLGRMLTVAAQYANYSGDVKLVLRQRKRLVAVANLLLALREKALQLPAEDPAYGMIAGWCEADSCLDPDPARYMRPYFSNSSEAARGFEELGAVWERVGKAKRQAELAQWGRRLRQEAEGLTRDLNTAMARSMLTNEQPPCLPVIAGAKEPPHVAVKRDKLDPQFRAYRAYPEMLYSGILSAGQARAIVQYRVAHRDVILGLPMAYGYDSDEMGGFLAQGHAYGLIRLDAPREFLLMLYCLAAHQYTRGTWTAPETRTLDPGKFALPYCAPAQVQAPLMIRWMLVFEEPDTGGLWLAKATPRAWLEQGQRIVVKDAPTRRGRIGFELQSRMGEGQIEAAIDLPSKPGDAPIKLRLRVPGNRQIRSVKIGGKPWDNFDPREETVTLPRGAAGKLRLAVGY